MEFTELFTMLGLDTGTVVSIATMIYGGVALLRSELPSAWTEAWRSKAIGIVLAILLSWKAASIEDGVATVILTGVAAWAVAMVSHKWTKGTKLEIKRNGGDK